MATTPTLILPPPASNAGSNWQKAWTAYQKDPVGNYAAYYNFLAAGSTSGPLLQQGNYPAPGSPGAPTPQNPGGTVTPPAPAGSLAGFPGGAPTAAPPLMISQLGLPPSQVDQLALQAYRPGVSAGTGALPSTTGTPTPVLPSTTTPAPTPPPGTTPPGASGPGSPAQSGGTGTGYGGQGTAGNAGGAEGNHGGFGSTGGGGTNTQSNNAGGNGGLPSQGSAGGWSTGNWSPIDPYGGIDIGRLGSGLLGTASILAPGYAGLGLGALQAAMRAYNLTNTNTIRGTQGIPDTDFWQAVGGLVGANNYGGTDGNRTIANPDQYGAVQSRIDSQQLGNDPFASFFKTNSLGAPTAETLNGAPYQEGPGGILGWIGRGLGIFDGPQPAASVQTTNDQLSGMEAVKQLAAETGLSLAQAQALLDRDNPAKQGQNGLGLAKQVYSAPIGPTISGAPMAASVLSAKDQAKAAAELALYNAKNGYGNAGGGSSNEAMGGGGNNGEGLGSVGSMSSLGAGTGRQDGGADPGGASGGADQRGDHYAKGGYIGHPGLGLAIGPPVPPGYADRIAPRPDMLGMTPDTNRMPVDGPPSGPDPMAYTDLQNEMDAESAGQPGTIAPVASRQGGVLPVPGQKPAAPNPLAREADLQKMLIAQAKAVVKGKPVRAKQPARKQVAAGPSESDLLNAAELARHQPQQASLPQGAIPMMAQGGPIPPGNMSAAPSPRLENAMPPTASMPSAQGMTGLQPNPQEEYLYQHHVGNLAGGAAVHNQDGSTSTVFQTVVPGPGGLFYNIPTVWDGKILPPEQAYRRAAQIGLDKFPAYRTPEEADSRYMQMHGQMERDILPSMAGGGQVAGQPDQTMDNRPIMANEGEFVIRNSAAKALGPHLLGLLNDPRGAAMVKARLGLGLARAA